MLDVVDGTVVVVVEVVVEVEVVVDVEVVDVLDVVVVVGPVLTLSTTTEPLLAFVVGRGACENTSPTPNSSFGSFTVVDVSPAAVTSASASGSCNPTTAGTTT